MSTTTPLPSRYYPLPDEDYNDKDSGSGSQPVSFSLSQNRLFYLIIFAQ